MDHQEEIEFFEYLSKNIRTTKKTIETGKEVDLNIFGESDFLEEIKTKYKYKEVTTDMTPNEVLTLIKQFCDQIYIKYKIVMTPSSFINKWGLVHLSVYLDMFELFKAFSNVPGVDMFNQFSTKGLQQALLLDEQINNNLKKLRTITFPLPRITKQEKIELSKELDSLIQKENMINPESLLSKYSRYDSYQRKHVDYYVFEFGLWKKFVKRQGKDPVYMNYDLWIFGATPFHFIEKYIEWWYRKDDWRSVVLGPIFSPKSEKELHDKMYTSKVRRNPKNSEKWQTLFVK
jgi:hypothetical protein